MISHRIVWLTCALAALAGLLAYGAGTTPPATTVIVEWTTASELDTAGFNLYRGDTADGPFMQVNDYLIPSAADPLVGGSYVFTDTHVVAGQTYYYQLEDVETDGTTTRHGPITVQAEGSRRTLFSMALILFVAATFGLITLLTAIRRHYQNAQLAT
jgi:hypothetical protein